MYQDTCAQLDPEAAAIDRHRILIVEDDQAQVDVLSHRLDQQGFETISTTSDRRGLALAHDEHPHVILLDLRLPDVDGLSICRALADDTATCNIPIVIVSGMEQPDIIRRTRAAGCRFYVRKPYDPNALLALILAAIQSPDAW